MNDLHRPSTRTRWAQRLRHPLRSWIVCATFSLFPFGMVHAQPEPMAVYDFENGANLGEDSSLHGASHHGSVHGSPSRDTSEVRSGASSIRMHGNQNQYITVPDHSELDATDQLTVAFWAKPTATGIDNHARAILSKRTGFNQNIAYSLFLPNSGGDLTLYLDDGGSIPNTITTGYEFHTEWQHVVMVFDGNLSPSERVRLYVDGVLHGTYPHSAVQIRDQNSPLTLGSLNPNFKPNGQYITYDGWLDDVRIYRDALSAAEVSALYGISPAGYWAFNDGSGSVAADSSVNALDIALQGTYAWMDGQYGGAVHLGGQPNTYGVLADPIELEDTEQLSIAFWVRPENLDKNARFLVSKRDSENVNSAFSVFFWKNNRLYVDLNNNSNGNRHSTSAQFQNNTWYHIGVVYDGTLPQGERGRVYIDGDLDANSPFGVSTSSIPDYPSDFHLGIANVGYARTFGGRIDDLVIFREALQESEVEAIMANEASEPPASGSLVFSENFDAQADWTSTMHTTVNSQKVTNGHVLPAGWDGIYQGTQWSPERGYPDNHASLEILGSNADKARGGVGKSAVFWRESYSLGWKNWASDAQFIKFLDDDYEELYAEFWIKFSPDWWNRPEENRAGWTSKIFRIGHWDGTGEYWNGQTKNVNPRVFWDYKVDNYGARNVLTFFRGPPGSKSNMSEGGSLNFKNHTAGMAPGGSDPQLYDQSGYPNQSNVLLKDIAESLSHDQVFGPAEKWTKVAFYVKMNSSPGAADGVFKQWLDGERIVNYTNLEWVQENAENLMVGWNYFAIGGNDYFQPYPNSERFEDWYTIDDVKIFDSLPDDLQ